MQHSLTRAPRLPALIGFLVSFFLFGQAQAQAQTLSTMMYFDQVSPQGGLVTDGVGLFGATTGGGYAPGGLLYRLAVDGSAINTIYEYGRLDVWQGANPGAALMLSSDTNLYGVTTLNSINTVRGTVTGTGTIFRVARDGQNYTKLFEFEDLTTRDSRGYLINTTGSIPQAALIEGPEASGTYLYGTTFQGGTNGTGTVFKIRTDGTGFLVLGDFAAIITTTGTDPAGNPINIPALNVHNELRNSNGVNPNQRLTLGGDGNLYGVTRTGGTNGTGVIFSVPVAGGAIVALHEFGAIVPGDAAATPPTVETNTQGAYPLGGLTLSGGILYGTTSRFGTAPTVTNGLGTVFRIALDGTGFTVLRAFNTTDGAIPSGDLIITTDGNNLAGTTLAGGTLAPGVAGTASGTVYKLSLNGVTLSQECVFNTADGGAKGTQPQNGVVQTADGNFYGTTAAGGYQYGLIFKCGNAYSGQLFGIRPPYEDEGSGALPLWMIAVLLAMLAMQVRARRARHR